MIEQVNGFITPMKGWDAVEKNYKKITGTENGTNYVFSTVRTASDTGRGTGFGSTDNSAERKECVSGIRTGKVRLLMRL